MAGIFSWASRAVSRIAGFGGRPQREQRENACLHYLRRGRLGVLRFAQDDRSETVASG